MASYSVGSGGSYKVSTGSASMERMTRGAADDKVLQRFIERAEKRRPPVDDSGEADLRWGEPSRFTLVQGEQQPTNPGYSYAPGGGGDEDEPVPPEAEVLQFTEVQKAVEDVRVENPNDTEQYVIVRRRVWSIFSGADGIYRQFHYNNEGLG